MLSTELRHNHIGVGTRIVGVVQGYRPQVDWGGETGSATIVVGGHNVRVATSGWRRRCLYTLLVALLTLSVVNLSLTLWILKTIHFNVDGMSLLHVVVGGVKMQGKTLLMEKVSTASITSRREKNLVISGYHNLSVFTVPFLPPSTADATDQDLLSAGDVPLSHTSTFLHLNVDNVLAGTHKFKVRGPHGEHLFQASASGSSVGAERLTVTGDEGAEFEGTIQTPLVYSQGVHELRLESWTRRVSGEAAQEVRVEARDGDISATSLKEAYLQAHQGAIRIDSPNIFLPKLPEYGVFQDTGAMERDNSVTETPQESQIPAPEGENMPTTPLPSPPSQDAHTFPPVRVYQVCVCPSGRLFLVTASSACVPDDEVCR
ncbi:hypothetical protein OTU49_016171 [Cherax quadricarinatus]|uniref:Zeta-sarcoglycan n=1 Tax=Cherax quadricarinatus TaxID=27406 RepID=A0AAW0XTF3_CHEQU|nr:delta-sarcoglycan-like isoform X2 [Cherax quadricarinatus]